jgi:hypothetical protein
MPIYVEASPLVYESDSLPPIRHVVQVGDTVGDEVISFSDSDDVGEDPGSSTTHTRTMPDDQDEEQSSEPLSSTRGKRKAAVYKVPAKRAVK